LRYTCILDRSSSLTLSSIATLRMLIFFVEGDSEFELTDKVNKFLDKISLFGVLLIN